jgi:hypothetical protein
MLVPAERLPAANATLLIGQEAAMAAGALAGGILVATGGAVPALAGNFASYLVAAGLFAGIVPSFGAVVRKRGGRGLVAGLRYVRTRRPVLVLIAAFGLTTVATGLTNASLPRFLSELGLGAEGYGYGLAALAAGLIAGEAAAGHVTGRVQLSWLGGSLAGMAVLFAGLAWSGVAVGALALLALIGVANGVAEVVVTTLVQRESDPDYHGRVFAALFTVSRVTMLGAVAAAPLVNAVAAPREAILLAAAALAIGACVVWAGARQPLSARLSTA